jgi:hypothetical protein
MTEMMSSKTRGSSASLGMTERKIRAGSIASLADFEDRCAAGVEPLPARPVVVPTSAWTSRGYWIGEEGKERRFAEIFRLRQPPLKMTQNIKPPVKRCDAQISAFRQT